ncbi:hypothetical protein HDG37_007478 [Paraburkholderia sp. MM5384-R2]|nr:hypothetical protein [Paraburkholderia sp. MM5384-R2]
MAELPKALSDRQRGFLLSLVQAEPDGVCCHSRTFNTFRPYGGS